MRKKANKLKNFPYKGNRKQERKEKNSYNSELVCFANEIKWSYLNKKYSDEKVQYSP